MLNQDGLMYAAGHGLLYASHEMVLLHEKFIPPNFVKISVDAIYEGFEATPLPYQDDGDVEDDGTSKVLEAVRGGFTLWPANQVLVINEVQNQTCYTIYIKYILVYFYELKFVLFKNTTQEVPVRPTKKTPQKNKQPKPAPAPSTTSAPVTV